MFKVGDRVKDKFANNYGTVSLYHHATNEITVVWDNGNTTRCGDMDTSILELEKPTGITNPAAQELQDAIPYIPRFQKWLPAHSKADNFWTREWIGDSGHRVPIIRTPEVKKCECGSSAVGSSMHSDYCPLHE